MNEPKAWPGVYRSRYTGDVVLFTSIDKGYTLMSPSGISRVGDYEENLIDCTDYDRWERVTLRAEPAKNVAPDAPKWPAVYRSRTSGQVVLFTDLEEGYCVAHPAKPVCVGEHISGWIPCDAPRWECVDLYADEAASNRDFAETMTRVAEAERSAAMRQAPSAQPAPAEPAPMNLFQTLAWLDANRGAELEVVKPGSTSATRVRASKEGKLEQRSHRLWGTWRPDTDRGAEYSATIPQRQLPTPPAGWEWRETAEGLRLARVGAHASYLLFRNDEELEDAKDVHAARACLIAEYETRPR